MVRETVKHPVKVQVWGCLTSKGFGKISCFSGTLNAARLCRICRNALLPSAREAFGASQPLDLAGRQRPEAQKRSCEGVAEEQWCRANGLAVRALT